jgi:hypothetical protein
VARRFCLHPAAGHFYFLFIFIAILPYGFFRTVKFYSVFGSQAEQQPHDVHHEAAQNRIDPLKNRHGIPLSFL